MSNLFYESVGRAAVWGMRRQVRQSMRTSSVRYGAVGALAVGVVVVGAVFARSHTTPE